MIRLAVFLFHVCSMNLVASSKAPRTEQVGSGQLMFCAGSFWFWEFTDKFIDKFIREANQLSGLAVLGRSWCCGS